MLIVSLQEPTTEMGKRFIIIVFLYIYRILEIQILQIPCKILVFK